MDSIDGYDRFKFKWLRFSAESGVFGTKNRHLGFVVSVNNEDLFCVAVNVTSKWDSRDQARIARGDAKETIVWIRAGSEKGSYHFAKDSVIDCAFPRKIPCMEFNEMIESEDIELVMPRGDVPGELVDEVRRGILASRVVPNIIKKSL